MRYDGKLELNELNRLPQRGCYDVRWNICDRRTKAEH
jgi:hypothetical protein